MSTLVLLVMIGGAFWWQYRVDVKNILLVAAAQGWDAPRVRWWPELRGRRGDRHYWLQYLDAEGRLVRRLCRVTGIFNGPDGVFFEAESDALGAKLARLTSASRLGSIVLFTALGGFLGVALGIGAALLVYPGSNIAPAYGLIFGAPLGLGAGALFGALRRR